ncbi:sensory rhodopsin transducer [Rhodoligotrophos defluvii]|uniref:sensory rhodopsin transducer n=1 Tax=Rhodoligotrophos defluvii TaxID=2561934 RepID=UPI0014854CDB|nr:sensory rhodopsin transducer [Rhodoligotrophos defluvii]
MPIGRRRWAIAEGYIPGESHGPAPAVSSHEAACILNAGERDAHIEIMPYFTHRDPVGPYRATVQHLRFNELNDPEERPRDASYSSIITSDEPVVVQHPTLETRQAENALLSTIAYSEA